MCQVVQRMWFCGKVILKCLCAIRNCDLGLSRVYDRSLIVLLIFSVLTFEIIARYYDYLKRNEMIFARCVFRVLFVEKLIGYI